MRNRGPSRKCVRCCCTKASRPTRRKGQSSCSAWLQSKRPGSKTHSPARKLSMQAPIAGPCPLPVLVRLKQHLRGRYRSKWRTFSTTSHSELKVSGADSRFPRVRVVAVRKSLSNPVDSVFHVAGAPVRSFFRRLVCHRAGTMSVFLKSSPLKRRGSPVILARA